MEQDVYRKKVKALREKRNKLRAAAAALRNLLRDHNWDVAHAFGPGEIDSHVRGSLMVDVFGEV